MKSATVSQLKNHLSKFLRLVKEGESVVVLDRGHPVAELKSRSQKDSKTGDHLKKLESMGILRRGDPDHFKNFPYPGGKGKTGVLETLLDERRSGR